MEVTKKKEYIEISSGRKVEVFNVCLDKHINSTTGKIPFVWFKEVFGNNKFGSYESLPESIFKTNFRVHNEIIWFKKILY